MDEKNKGLVIASSIVAIGLVVIAVAISFAPRSPQPNVTVEQPNITVGGDTNPTPVVVSGTNSAPNEKFGAAVDETTVWTSGQFTNDLTVSDDLTISGDTAITGGATVGGTLAVTGASTLTGAVTSNYLSKAAYTTITSVTATQSLCQLTNSSGSARNLKHVRLLFGTNASGAAVRPTISTAFTTTVATGTGATLLYDNPVTLSTASSTVTATSSLMTARTVWDDGETIQFNIASPTTTLTGNCIAEWD